MRAGPPDASRRRLLVALLVAIGGPARAGAPASGSDVSDQHVGGTLALSDPQGRLRRLADFRGKVVLLFFGYTRCPDVCPTTLLRMAEAWRLLGADAAGVQVLWMTVDPERDTRELVGNYVAAFNPGFLGLRGTLAQTNAVADAFKVHYDVTYYKDEVLVSHSAHGYLIDGQGRTRVKVDYAATPEQIAQDVRALLAESPGPRVRATGGR